ncbi:MULTISPECIES: hypothetical protein [Planktothrix]|jgi:hypothetical protein|uniref:hypothetical protein n=1 Tax=Planktothrix TaxID=54304 RepID=UPI0003FAC6FA|nr:MULTISPECIES: hypothetical protein [Planktothrix]CAD0229994.1 conserved hypothetical protein [Planktothrix agardhii]CAD5967829.1 hypothetical protein NO758_03568 [Planktothrix agardhii]
MLPQPISDDRALSQSLHQALIKRFSDALTPLNQSQLSECSFGFAPSPTGVKTFFIVTPSLLAAETLLVDLDQILERVQTLMIGVGQVAVCIQPQNNPAETPSSSLVCHPSGPHKPPVHGELGEGFHPEYMMCKVFPVNSVIASLED